MESSATEVDFSPGQEITWNSTTIISNDYGSLYLYPVWKDLPVTITITTPAPNADGITDIQLTYNKDSSTFSATLEDATAFKWYVDGTEQEKEVLSTMSIYKVPEGTHTVTVTTEKDGLLYSATMVVKTATSTSL